MPTPTTALHVDEPLGLYLYTPSSVEHANRERCSMETIAIRAMYARRALRGLEPGRYPETYVVGVDGQARPSSTRGT